MGRRWIDASVDAGLHDVFNDLRDFFANLFHIVVVLVLFVVLLVFSAFIVAALVAMSLAIAFLIILNGVSFESSIAFTFPGQFPIFVPMRTKELSFEQWVR
jgi:flagellar biosynthesis component FlhA